MTDQIDNAIININIQEPGTDDELMQIYLDIKRAPKEEAAKAIRGMKNADAAAIPIIAMTANAYESDIQNCMDAGMNAHLAKPVNPQKLYEVLYSYIAAKAK